MKQPLLNLSIRCYFPGRGNTVTHRAYIPLKEVPKWIDAYRFTHPTCQAITVKIWLTDEEWGNDVG